MTLGVTVAGAAVLSGLPDLGLSDAGASAGALGAAVSAVLGAGVGRVAGAAAGWAVAVEVEAGEGGASAANDGTVIVVVAATARMAAPIIWQALAIPLFIFPPRKQQMLFRYYCLAGPAFSAAGGYPTGVHRDAFPGRHALLDDGVAGHAASGSDSNGNGICYRLAGGIVQGPGK